MNKTIRELIDSHGYLSIDMASVSDGDDLYRLGLKSQACVELMLAFEDAFGIEFSDELLTRATFRSVGSIEKAVLALRQERSAA